MRSTNWQHAPKSQLVHCEIAHGTVVRSLIKNRTDTWHYLLHKFPPQFLFFPAPHRTRLISLRALPLPHGCDKDPHHGRWPLISSSRAGHRSASCSCSLTAASPYPVAGGRHSHTSLLPSILPFGTGRTTPLTSPEAHAPRLQLRRLQAPLHVCCCCPIVQPSRLPHARRRGAAPQRLLRSNNCDDLSLAGCAAS